MTKSREEQLREAFREWWDKQASENKTMYQWIQQAFYAGASLSQPEPSGAPLDALIDYVREQHQTYAYLAKRAKDPAKKLVSESCELAYFDVLKAIDRLPPATPAEVTAEIVWNRVEDGLPTEYGDYLTIREHAELHTIGIAATKFHPKSIHPWYDKGFNYLYWLGPFLLPEELKFEMPMGEIRYKVRRQKKAPIALAAAKGGKG